MMNYKETAQVTLNIEASKNIDAKMAATFASTGTPRFFLISNDFNYSVAPLSDEGSW